VRLRAKPGHARGGLLALASVVLLASAPACAVAAEGGPAANTPVPAGTAGATPATATATTAAAATSVPTTATANPSGGFTVTTIPPPASAKGSLAPRPRTRARGGSGGISTLGLVSAILAGLLLLACAGWALARALAFEPRWLLALRHSLAEAAYRGEAAVAELGDWLRLGH
jgi:hypothetical protein